MISITDNLALPDSEIQIDFIRSAGPGGQNVNKVATAAQLRFDVAHSPSLPDDVRQRLIRLAGKKATSDGVLIITARRFRSQEQNRQDAIDRLVAFIRKAAERPKPRLKTKPSAAAKHRRLEAKRQRGQLKQRRQFKPLAEE
jgi:ribosome-associated protein